MRAMSRLERASAASAAASMTTPFRRRNSFNSSLRFWKHSGTDPERRPFLRLGDEGADADTALDDAVVFELRDRFAHHRPRHAELGRQCLFGRQAITGPKLAGEQGAGQAGDDLLWQRRGALEGFELHLIGPVPDRRAPACNPPLRSTPVSRQAYRNKTGNAMDQSGCQTACERGSRAEIERGGGRAMRQQPNDRNSKGPSNPRSEGRR